MRKHLLMLHSRCLENRTCDTTHYFSNISSYTKIILKATLNRWTFLWYVGNKFKELNGIYNFLSYLTFTYFNIQGEFYQQLAAIKDDPNIKDKKLLHFVNYLVASTDYPSFYKVMVRAAKKVRAKEYDCKWENIVYRQT